MKNKEMEKEILDAVKTFLENSDAVKFQVDTKPVKVYERGNRIPIDIVSVGRKITLEVDYPLYLEDLRK